MAKLPFSASLRWQCGHSFSIMPVYPQTGSLSTGWLMLKYPAFLSCMYRITRSKALTFFDGSPSISTYKICIIPKFSQGGRLSLHPENSGAWRFEWYPYPPYATRSVELSLVVTVSFSQYFHLSFLLLRKCLPRYHHYPRF